MTQSGGMKRFLKNKKEKELDEEKAARMAELREAGLDLQRGVTQLETEGRNKDPYQSILDKYEIKIQHEYDKYNAWEQALDSDEEIRQSRVTRDNDILPRRKKLEQLKSLLPSIKSQDDINELKKNIDYVMGELDKFESHSLPQYQYYGFLLALYFCRLKELGKSSQLTGEKPGKIEAFFSKIMGGTDDLNELLLSDFQTTEHRTGNEFQESGPLVTGDVTDVTDVTDMFAGMETFDSGGAAADAATGGTGGIGGTGDIKTELLEQIKEIDLNIEELHTRGNHEYVLKLFRDRKLIIDQLKSLFNVHIDPHPLLNDPQYLSIVSQSDPPMASQAFGAPPSYQASQEFGAPPSYQASMASQAPDDVSLLPPIYQEFYDFLTYMGFNYEEIKKAADTHPNASKDDIFKGELLNSWIDLKPDDD